MKFAWINVVSISTVLFLIGLLNTANAGLITISDSVEITERGQTFTFNFDHLPSNIEGDLIFFINASGDFSDNQLNEFADISFSNLDLGIRLDESGEVTLAFDAFNGFSDFNFSSSTVIDNIDESFSAVLTLTSESKLAFLALATREIIALTGPSTNPFYHQLRAGTDRDFIEVGFTFEATEVPEPPMMAMFFISLVLLLSKKDDEKSRFV